MVERFLNSAKTFANGMLEVCSKVGEVKVSNVTFSNWPIISGFPAGDYKVSLRFYDDIDSNIYNFTYFAVVIK
jgi:DUF971 family protein